MSNIFEEENNEFDVSSQNTELEKALTAGNGTDAANYVDGRSLQREDLEATLVSVLDVKQKDLKLFHKLHKQPEKSTVHQIERQVGVGSDEFLFTGENEEAPIDDAEFQRKIYETKYLSSEWQVSHALTQTDTVGNPIDRQKLAATMRVSRATERAIFHGNSAASPKQFDGILKILEDSANNTDVSEKLRATVFDARGLEIGESSSDLGISFDEEKLDEISELVYNKGGDLAEAYFPPVLASQFKRLYSDRLRLTTSDDQFTLNKLPDIVTAIGSTIKIKDDCGADKMFKVKGPVIAAGNSSKRPNTPTGLTASAGDTSVDGFTTGFAGDYMYAVHAINQYGISAAKPLGSAVTVAAGKKVTLTITPDTNGAKATGFIITRSNANGTELMEMVRIKAGADSTTTYVDLNNDLPGTAQLVLLTPETDEMIPNASFAQLMGLSNFDLPTNSALTHHGVVALYGNFELRAPEYCGLIKNIGYKDGLY